MFHIDMYHTRNCHYYIDVNTRLPRQLLRHICSSQPSMQRGNAMLQMDHRAVQLLTEQLDKAIPIAAVNSS